ncbi:MAG: hypothetical protein NT075_12380 [Chloroflexi bacterium]|nr:hypothetical protein [Chloroflexota bacterium]
MAHIDSNPGQLPVRWCVDSHGLRYLHFDAGEFNACSHAPVYFTDPNITTNATCGSKSNNRIATDTDTAKLYYATGSAARREPTNIDS